MVVLLRIIKIHKNYQRSIKTPLAIYGALYLQVSYLRSFRWAKASQVHPVLIALAANWLTTRYPSTTLSRYLSYLTVVEFWFYNSRPRAPKFTSRIPKILFKIYFWDSFLYVYNSKKIWSSQISYNIHLKNF